MKNVLCLTDTLDDVGNFIKNAQLLFFEIEQLEPEEHSLEAFSGIYEKLKNQTDLSQIDLVIAEYIEAIPLVFFMRRDGYYCPAIYIPHTNPYPMNILLYFLMVSHLQHPDDLILCGSENAKRGYEKIVDIKAEATCTFGIKRSYMPGSQEKSRKKLGIPLEKKYLLYTGRFMNDKGLTPLLQVFRRLKSKIGKIGLILSITHFDPNYYNSLASQLEDAILFYRLEKEQMPDLYRSADLFVSLATSIFETYGKSPMEAISSGVPAVLPKWDGFQSYINDGNGSLANVNYCEAVPYSPYSFAEADVEDYTDKCYQWLVKERGQVSEPLPEWAYVDTTMETLSKKIQNILLESTRFIGEKHLNTHFSFDRYPLIVRKILEHYGLCTCEEIVRDADQIGLIDRENGGDLALLHELHDTLFKTMDATDQQTANVKNSPYALMESL